MRWTRGRVELEMVDEPLYSFGSVDSTFSYGDEILLEAGKRPDSKHGLRCFVEGEIRGSAVLGAPGGVTEVHEKSCVLLTDRCLVSVGNRLAALGLPGLCLLWQVEADQAACFGLYATPDERHVVVHGELAISKYTFDGQREWEYAGRDIFTGACAIRDGAVCVVDFDGTEYEIDLMSGRGGIVKDG